MDNEDLKLNPDYLSRKVNESDKPKFKLHAYCINLDSKIDNMSFIHDEWDEFLDIERFPALSSATHSHAIALENIWKIKDYILFPIIVMEDDVYRRKNFTKYWNQLVNINNCDYITFDILSPIFKSKQNNCPNDFFSLKSHSAMGFKVYYKHFFDRFESVKDLNRGIVKPFIAIDETFTRNPIYINYTPKEQVCRQIVSKVSTSNNLDTSHYNDFYKLVEKDLLEFNKI